MFCLYYSAHAYNNQLDFHEGGLWALLTIFLINWNEKTKLYFVSDHKIYYLSLPIPYSMMSI